MGQKVNPNGFRLGITDRAQQPLVRRQQRAGQRYRDYVKEDVAIRRMMSKGMERAGISQRGHRAHP